MTAASERQASAAQPFVCGGYVNSPTDVLFAYHFIYYLCKIPHTSCGNLHNILWKFTCSFSFHYYVGVSNLLYINLVKILEKNEFRAHRLIFPYTYIARLVSEIRKNLLTIWLKGSFFLFFFSFLRTTPRASLFLRLFRIVFPLRMRAV